MQNGAVSIKELEHYCHDLQNLTHNTDGFSKTQEICSKQLYANSSNNVTLRNIHAEMVSELMQFNPNQPKVKTRASSLRVAVTEDYADKLPPQGTVSTELTQTVGTHTQTATVSLWSENNTAFIRFTPSGQHFNIDPYSFTFMQDGMQTKTPDFIRINQSFSGNIYAARTFKLSYGPCNSLPFTAEFIDGSTLSYTPTTVDASACSGGGATCSEVAPPEGTPFTTVTDYNSQEAKIYAWSDGEKSYVHVAPVADSFYFQTYYYPVMQYGMRSDAYFYNCSNEFYGGYLDISALKSGVYLVQVTGENGLLHQQKILKQ